jgi:5S rRNA maturation endonuclease (ribonuclease M5)
VNSPAVQRVVDALRDAKWKAGPKEYEARCPAHDDDKPSLRVREGRDARAVIHCHAGCEVESILRALNLSMLDLFENEPNAFPKQPSQAASSSGTPAVTYCYEDESGQLLCEVLRYEPKAFSQRRPDDSGGWLPNVAGVPLTLYRLPELLVASPAEPVMVVEGEKDVETLRERGFVATCARGGASSQLWKHESACQALKGRDIVLMPDNDKAGRDYAERAGRALLPIAKSIRVVELEVREKGDVSDYFNAGHEASELRELIGGAPRFDEWQATRQPVDSATDVVQLIPAWEKPATLKREFLWEGLIPEGYPSIICGDGSTGKTWLALALAYHVATGTPFLGRSCKATGVVYVDAEGLGRDEIQRRLGRIANAEGTEVPQRVWIIELVGALDEAKAEKIAHHVASVGAGLVVVDSFGPATDFDATGAEHVTRWFRRVLPILSATVLIVDHIAKPSQQSYRATPYGSTYKRNLARSVLMVQKRSGHVVVKLDKSNVAEEGAELRVVVSIDDELAAFYLMDSTKWQPKSSMRNQVLAALSDAGEGVRAKEIADKLGVKEKSVSNALTTLKQNGEAINAGKGVWRLTEQQAA